MSAQECPVRGDAVGSGVGVPIDAINSGAMPVDGWLYTMTPDDLLDERSIRQVDFSKKHIEGGELDALRGAECPLRRDRPRFANSNYHRPENFFAIPRLIRRLGIGSRLYLDYDRIRREEAVLYAQL